MRKLFASSILLLMALALPCFALDVVPPEEAGLNPDVVKRIDTMMQGFVDNNMVAGGVAVLERDGKIGFKKVFGKQSIETGAPMAEDSIFRIFSMTKPITGTALMMLYEEGKFGLDDPLGKYLPALANLQVAVLDESAPEGFHTEPAKREITVRDLLRHTAGLTYGFFDTTPVDKLYQDKKVLDPENTLEEMVEILGTIPLMHQPGSVWDYSVAVDVQGRLVEVLSGQKLDVFFQERIFGPLGMVDTGFYVPEEKKDRFCGLYSLSMSMKLEVPTDKRMRDFTQKPKMLSGGGGLVSTAHDYLQFCRMMLNGGELNGKRLLKPETVALMTQDHLGDIPQSPIALPLGMRGAGFGLGFAVTKEAFKDTRGSVGEYNWGGVASTYFWIDPKEKMIGVYMIQIFPTQFSTPLKFKKMSYDAIEEDTK